MSLRDKSSLIFEDEAMEIRLEVHGKDFINEFVGGFSKQYGSKMREGGEVVFFGDYSKESRVGIAPNFLLPLDPLYHFDQILFYKIPMVPIKADREPIWPRCLIRVQGPNCMLDFFLIYLFIEGVVHLLCDHSWKVLQ